MEIGLDGRAPTNVGGTTKKLRTSKECREWKEEIHALWEEVRGISGGKGGEEGLGGTLRGGKGFGCGMKVGSAARRSAGEAFTEMALGSLKAKEGILNEGLNERVWCNGPC